MHSQKFYLQTALPENSALYCNIIIYQLQLRLENNEIWVSNLGAQTQQPEQELTPLILLSPPYGRIVYDYTNPMWIPNAIKNAQSNCKKTEQNRHTRLDIRNTKSITNNKLRHWRIIIYGNKITLRPPQRRMSTDTFHKSNNSLGPQTHCQLFELIRFDAFMVKYQDRYWIETNAEWTTVQQHDKTQKKNE